MREEKKYEILPGVELPDFKTIKEAASDFSISDVGDVEVHEVKIEPDSISASVTPSVSPEELAKLQSLGNKVAEDEARAQAESKKKMDEIKKKAVHASESISDLKSSNMGKVTDEKRKEIEESLAAEQQQKAEEDAKAKAREERRQLQLRLYEEAKERAAKEKAAAAEAEAKAKAEDNAENKAEDKPAAETTADAAEKAPVEEKAVAETAAEAAEKPAEAAAEKQEKQPAADTAASEKPAEAVKEEPKAETKEEPKSEPAPKAEAKAPEINPERFVKDDKREATIASAEETYDDFKEFLDLGEEE